MNLKVFVFLFFLSPSFMLGQCLLFDSQIDGQSQPIVFLTDENQKKEITLFSDGSYDYLNVHSGLKEEKLSFKNKSFIPPCEE